ncbi:DUF2232 domain-containing protein [Crocosphaera sp. Alani8]|uniref:DUF2232 domain-containing protein n=1 Tax=Crocosphaera sp. Alani8 TaxID=3038952 RepID=UPI00313DD2A0
MDDSNWVDEGDELLNKPELTPAKIPTSPLNPKSAKIQQTLAMVETAFLASAGSLIWLINYYFPLGPLFRIFFPLPIALLYLRWGNRAAWMGALVSGLLLTVLMGPTRSIVFLMPYGFIGVQLGAFWRRNVPWEFSIITGSLLSTFGLFFRFWLFSILLGEDLWQYITNQMAGFAEWIFLRVGILAQPSSTFIQGLVIFTIFVNSLIYLLSVHLVALLVLDKLGNPIPRPPKWVQIILDYE